MIAWRGPQAEAVAGALRLSRAALLSRPARPRPQLLVQTLLTLPSSAPGHEAAVVSGSNSSIEIGRRFFVLCGSKRSQS